MTTAPQPPRRYAWWAHPGLLAECTLALAWAAFTLRRQPFRRIASGLQRGADHSGPADEAAAQRIAWALHAVNRRLPRPLACLGQALAAHTVLRRHGLPAVVYLGVDPAKPLSAGLDAHAWVRSGEVVVSGGPGHERYAPIATFQPPPGRG